VSRLSEVSPPTPTPSTSRLVPVGLISLLQIQKDKLIGDTPDGQVYRTTSLVAVGELKVGRAGVIAEVDGGWVLDRHHTAHPAETRAHRPDRILSIGFSRHYKLIEDEFGWAPPGVAGENIIVDTADRLHHQDVAGGFVIRTSGGDVELDPPPMCSTRAYLSASSCSEIRGHRFAGWYRLGGSSGPACGDTPWARAGSRSMRRCGPGI